MADHPVHRIAHYFPETAPGQLKQFEVLCDLYIEWNSKINVISRKDVDYIVERHFLHSLAIAKILQFRPGAKVLDVGTGGGFPGVPLAIFFPEVNFHLVDSIAKKIKVIEAISAEMKLGNVRAQWERMENIRGQYDFIVSRAVAPMETIRYWTERLIRKKSEHELGNGYLFLKGGDLEEEIKQSGLRATTYVLSDYFAEPFFETKKIIHATLL